MTMKPYPVVGPWKGIITDIPSGNDPQAWDTAQNTLFRHLRMVSRPGLALQLGAPPDGSSILRFYSFLDALNNWHTLVLTAKSAYFLTNPAGALVYNALTLPFGIADLSGTGLPYGLIEINQQVFFCNGSQPLMYVDGSSNVYVAGNVPGSCRYLTENSSHLIGVNWQIPSPGIAGSTAFPFYVRFSDAGNPLDWIPSISNSAGIINLIEKGGVPIGAQTLGTYTYIWRQYGANVLWPTGQASAPFYNEPFSWSDPGWGAFYPYTICTWNTSGLLVSHNGEVLQFTGPGASSSGGFTPLAQGKVKKQLAQDLKLAVGGQVFAFITDQLGPGYDFESYVIWIPGLNKAWILNLAEGTWSTATSNNQYATAFGNIKVH